MGLHAAAGCYVSMDWHVSRAFYSLYRKACEFSRQADQARLPDSGRGGSRANDNGRAADNDYESGSADSASAIGGKVFIHTALQRGEVRRIKRKPFKRFPRLQQQPNTALSAVRMRR